jgi:hypothetical protein
MYSIYRVDHVSLYVEACIDMKGSI